MVVLAGVVGVGGAPGRCWAVGQSCAEVRLEFRRNDAHVQGAEAAAMGIPECHAIAIGSPHVLPPLIQLHIDIASVVVYSSQRNSFNVSSCSG